MKGLLFRLLSKWKVSAGLRPLRAIAAFWQRNEIWIASFILILTLVWFIRQMWQIGFTTGDDVAVSGMTAERILAQIRQIEAGENGVHMRPTFYFAMWLHYLRLSVFGYDHFGFRLSAVLPILMEIGLFSILAKQLLRLNWVKTLYIAALIIVSMQHAWMHHSISAFVFNFHFGFSILLASFCLVYQSFRSLNVLLALAAGCLFGSGVLIYEMFATYALLFPLIITMSVLHYRESGKNFSWKKFFSCMAVLSVPALSGMSLLVFGYLSPKFTNTYEGTAIGKTFNWAAYWDALVMYSTSVVPGRIFRHYHHIVGQYWGIGGITGMESQITSLRFWPIWVLMGLLGGFSTFGLLVQKNRFKFIPLLLLALVGILFVFAPNALISMAEGHQNRRLIQEITYSGSYFSLFGWVFLVSVIGYVIAVTRFRFVQYMFALLCSVYAANLIYKAHISNSAVANLQSLQHARWRLLDKLYYEGALDEAIASGKPIRAGNSMMGHGDQFWGVFHGGGGWGREVYWYNFTYNAYGEHIPIFTSESHCRPLYGAGCYKDTPFELSYKVEYPQKKAYMTICNRTNNECSRLDYRARL